MGGGGGGGGGGEGAERGYHHWILASKTFCLVIRPLVKNALLKNLFLNQSIHVCCC